MYVGSAHGMIFLMNASMDTSQPHVMYSENQMIHNGQSVNSNEHATHTNIDESSHKASMNQGSSMMDHDMQSCLDHCLAAVAISYSFYTLLPDNHLNGIITSLDASYYSLHSDITSPPPKFKLF